MHDILNGFINDWSRKVDETKIIVIKKVNKDTVYVRAILCLSCNLYYTKCHFQKTTSYSKSSQRGAIMTEWD